MMRHVTEYSVNNQVALVYAVTGLYNFIVRSRQAKEREEEEQSPEEKLQIARILAVASERARVAVKPDMKQTRRNIASHLYLNQME